MLNEHIPDPKEHFRELEAQAKLYEHLITVEYPNQLSRIENLILALAHSLPSEQYQSFSKEFDRLNEA